MRRFKRGPRLKTFIPSKNLEGHIFAYGRIGSGKSVSLLTLAQFYRDLYGFKIWDLFGGDRHEGLYWAIPSADMKYWRRFKMLGSIDEEGPKQYDVTFLYPYFGNKLPKKLPKKLPYVKSKLFTIPIKDVNIDDVKVAIGNVSDRDKHIWNEVVHTLKKKDTMHAAVELAKKLKATSYTIYKNFIVPLSRQNFLMDSHCDYNLDVKAEAKAKDEVTVLCLDFVPNEFRVFIVNYLIRKLKDLVEANQVGKRNIILMREAATFFRATDDSVLDDNLKIFRQQMSHYIRMGRTGMFFLLDCQSPWETKGLVQGCLSDDTEIKIFNGDGNIVTTPIADLPESFEVQCYDFENQAFLKENARKVHTGTKPVYKIMFEQGQTVVATSEHRFFNSNGVEVNLSDLSVGDSLLFKDDI